MPVPTPTHYQVLMLDPGVDADVLATVYRRHVQRLAAVPGGSGAATRQLQAIEQAYAVLRDPFRRRRYDAELAVAAPGRSGRTSRTLRSRPARGSRDPLSLPHPVHR